MGSCTKDTTFLSGAVLLICISGAVILHFITRYLYLRAHRQLLSQGHQQQAPSSSTGNAGARLSGAPGVPPRNDIEMNHSMKPTVLVVQPNEEVCPALTLLAGTLPDMYCPCLLPLHQPLGQRPEQGCSAHPSNTAARRVHTHALIDRAVSILWAASCVEALMACAAVHGVP